MAERPPPSTLPVEPVADSGLWYPEILVLGPGGVRGLVEVGALICFEFYQRLHKVRTVIGVSIGSIIGLLWVSGYSPMDIAVECMRFSLLNENRSLFDLDICSELNRIAETWGAISKDRIEARLNELMLQKFGFIPSLQELQRLTGKELVCVAVNSNKDEIEYFRPNLGGDISAVRAVLASSSIPGAIEPTIWQGQLYIDGALRNPYPIQYLDDGQTKILGLYIVSNLTVPKNGTGDPTAVLTFVFRAYSSLMDELYRRSRSAASEACLHLELPAPTIDTTGLTVTPAVKMKMLVQGFFRALDFLFRLGRPDLFPPVPKRNSA